MSHHNRKTCTHARIKKGNIMTNTASKLAIALVVMLVAASAVSIFAEESDGATRSGDCGDDLTWTFDNTTGNLVITGSGKMTDFKDKAAPWYSFKDSIKSISLPEGLTYIGTYAFVDCSAISGELRLPTSIIAIGDNAFEGCKGFSGNLKLPSNLIEIGDNAFEGCSGFTGSLVFGDKFETLGNSAFASCSGFDKDLTIGKTLKIVSDNAFEGCNGFEGKLTVGEAVTEIGAYAFSDCGGFTAITFPSSLSTVGIDAFDSIDFYSDDTTTKLSASAGNLAGYTFTGDSSKLIRGGAPPAPAPIWDNLVLYIFMAALLVMIVLIAAYFFIFVRDSVTGKK